MDRASVNVIWTVCNSKQKWNHDECWCETIDDWVSRENGYMWNPSLYDFESNRTCRLDQYLGTKKCSCEKCLIGKLVFAFEDVVLNITEKSLDDKKVIYKISLVGSLVII